MQLYVNPQIALYVTSPNFKRQIPIFEIINYYVDRVSRNEIKKIMSKSIGLLEEDNDVSCVLFDHVVIREQHLDNKELRLVRKISNKVIDNCKSSNYAVSAIEEKRPYYFDEIITDLEKILALSTDTEPLASCIASAAQTIPL